MNSGRVRLQQDIRYFCQGLLASLVILLILGVFVAALTLMLLAIAPGSIGETFRTLLPPSQVTAWLLWGVVVAVGLLWLLPRWGLFSLKTSLRLRWFLGVTAVVSVGLSALLG